MNVDYIEARVRWTFRVEGPESAEELAASAQKVMDALLELEKCDADLSDAGVAMDADAMTVDVELRVSGSSETSVVQHAQATVRTAIHAAGNGTPNWPVRPTDTRLGHRDAEAPTVGTFTRQQFSIDA